MAKTRKVTDQEQLEFYINEFIKRCESEHMKPSDYNLCKFLSISQSTLDRYYRGGKEAKHTRLCTNSTKITKNVYTLLHPLKACDIINKVEKNTIFGRNLLCL